MFTKAEMYKIFVHIIYFRIIVRQRTINYTNTYVAFCL